MQRQTLYIASLAMVLALPLSANDQKHDSKDHRSDHSGKSMEQKTTGKLSQTSSPRAIRLSQLLEADVTSRDGQSLGDVEDIIIEPGSGKILYAVLGQGGFLGMGEDYTPVPWSAVDLQSERSFTVNVDQERLSAAPKLKKDYSNFNDPNYSVVIYRFFAVPEGVGGAGSLEESPADESATSSGSSTNSNR